MNRKAMKRIMVMLVTLTLLYGCSSDDDGHAIAEKPVESLTVSGAMDWYNGTVGMLEKQKSTTDSSAEVPYKPSGNLAELFTNELWYAVESPLDFGDQSLMIMTPEVSDYTVTHGDDAIKQTLKLVVLRNKETGETYSFIMAVIPELDYMLRKGDGLNKITYLSRDSDFDGYIFFYTLDGQLINGWLYEEGKVAGGINLSINGQRTKIAKAVYMEIKVCGSYMVECGGGSGGGVDCYTYIEVVYVDDGIGNTASGGGVNDPENRPPSGNGPNSNLPLKPLPIDDYEGAEKLPDERTDCTEEAKSRAKDANTIMNLSINEINDKTNALRSMAKNNSDYEYSTSIGATDSKTFYMASIEKGTGNYATAGFAQSTIYGLHTHNNQNAYTGPSVADIYTLLQANNFLYKKYNDNEGYNLAGGIIFASDGSEYLISIEDRSKTNTFYKNQGSLFTPDSSQNYFQDSTLKVKFEDIMDNLLTKGYSHQNSYDFAMTYILDSYNTGIKISKKEAEEREFKEMKTEYKNVKIGYQPKKCP